MAPDRDRYVDLVRVVAIVVVVGGHWLTTSVFWEGDTVRSVNALSYIPATRVATWVMQVMPIVFFAGGFANARYLERSGNSPLGFLRGRLERLLAPTLVFLAVWTVTGLGIEWLDPGSPGKARAAETAALPVWFLGIYLVEVALVPGMLRLHRRWGVAVPVALAAAAGVVDVLSIGMGLEDLGGLNYAIVWLLAHQLGFLYADGRLQRGGRRLALVLTVGGLAALVGLTVWGGYPVSLVGVPGQPRSNAQPPSLAMVAGIAWLVGLVLLLRPSGVRLTASQRVWRRVSRAHRLLLTAFLWHVTAASVGAWLWRAAGWPEHAVGSAGWWAWRPLWVAVMLPPCALLMWGFGRFERHVPPGDGPPFDPFRGVAAGIGIFAVAVGILGFGETGFVPFAPHTGEAILMFTFNPLQNLVHLAVGAIGLWGAFVSSRPAVVGGAASVAFGALGLAEIAGWAVADPLGMDEITALTHVVVGALAVAALGLGAVSRFRRRGGPVSAA